MKSLILGNGMRVVIAPSPTDVVYCGIAIDAGTSDELETESGLAHFCEHMSFKGTKQRTSRQIISRLDSVGGDLNAFTGKEETVYYCTCQKEHFPRAIDLLFDIVFNSTFPQEEMDKEVEVVIDEIESYNDSPSELIYDEFEAMLFNGQPLGRNILGDKDRLREYRTEDFKKYTQRLYTPDRMVVFVYGLQPLSPNPFTPKGARGVDTTEYWEGLVAKYVPSSLTPNPSSLTPPHIRPTKDYTPLAPSGERGWGNGASGGYHQAHVMMGGPAYGGNDPRHLALYLANNILGGPSMGSRLALALREKTGLVYTVDSSITTYTNVGVWGIYFGCDKEDVKRCQRLTMREIHRLVDAPLSAQALEKAKRQLIGQLALSYDNFENVAIGMGKRMLHYGKTQTREELVARIQALTAEQVWDAARDVFNPDKISTLVIE